MISTHSNDENLSGILCKADEEELYEDSVVSGFMHMIDPNIDPMPLDYHITEESEDLKPSFLPSDNEVLPFTEVSVPSTEEYLGPYSFEVCISPSAVAKSSWEFSPKLNKIFVDMNNHIPVNFYLKNRPTSEERILFVRATTMYSQVQYSQEIVCRCINHSHANDRSNKDIVPEIIMHVLRCSNSNSMYQGNMVMNQRLSVIFPLRWPELGTDSVREMYHFVCKTSCPNGMNRRPIHVIFTLEDKDGMILGRQSVCARICSCPKRDREKEENAYDVAHSSDPNELRKGKKRRSAMTISEPPSKTTSTLLSESDSDLDLAKRTYNFTITVVGKSNMLRVLEYAEALMIKESAKIQPHPMEENMYMTCSKEISMSIKKLDSTGR